MCCLSELADNGSQWKAIMIFTPGSRMLSNRKCAERCGLRLWSDCSWRKLWTSALNVATICVSNISEPQQESQGLCYLLMCLASQALEPHCALLALSLTGSGATEASGVGGLAKKLKKLQAVLKWSAKRSDLQ